MLAWIVSLLSLRVDFLFFYFIVPFILVLLWYLEKLPYPWLAILIALGLDVLFFWQEWTYYESRGIMLYFSAFQVIFMAIVLWAIKYFTRKGK